MLPRIFKRHASTKKPPVRKGRKGHIYGPPITHPGVTLAEKVKITKRRIAKAERDERMDITMALTPVKTYMGGFTRPRDLRASNWFRGGAYVTAGKVYESPPATAYEPHTVFLLESRYVVKHGIGRVDSLDHVVGVCRAEDFRALLRKYNSAKCPPEERESMDNARWPWLPQHHHKRTKWWEPGESPQQVVREMYEGSVADVSYVSSPASAFEEGEDETFSTGKKSRKAAKKRVVSVEDAQAPSEAEETLTSESRAEEDITQVSTPPHNSRTDPWARLQPAFIPPDPSAIPPSASARNYSTKGSPSNDPNPNSPANTHEQNETTTRTEEETPGVTPGVQEGTPSGVTKERTTMQRPQQKIPAEFVTPDGRREQTSGSAVPASGATPTHDRPHDTEKQTEAVVEGTRETGALGSVSAGTHAPPEKVPVEVEREDGSVAHPSGFVPPAALDRERGPSGSRSYSTRFVPPAFPSVERQPPPHQPVPTPEPPEPAPDGPSTAEEPAESSQSTTDPVATSPASNEVLTSPEATSAPEASSEATSPSETKEALRARYQPTLATTPFWRPLLALTFATRPLALTVSRLAKARPRGLPFYASMVPDDRKCFWSYSARMRCMRADRLLALAADAGARLGGARGGFVGIRFGTADRGRGVDGAGLADALPPAVRTVRVGVGAWYARAGELAALAQETVECADVALVDEWGRRLDADGNVIAADAVDDGREAHVTDEGDGDDDESDEEEENYKKIDRMGLKDAVGQLEKRLVAVPLMEREAEEKKAVLELARKLSHASHRSVHKP